ncbi:MAG: DUF1854 domain-containing protein [candidate division Zixibacteria bacterium]|nr:DUF1854 domain-containing protein [candidate division Zixibacteria bacterium]
MADGPVLNLPQALSMKVLTPENCKVFKGIYSLLHVQITDDQDGIGLYRAIHAVRAFPISSPEEYVSLRYPDEHGIEKEIGVIIDLSTFPEDARALIEESLSRHYFEFHITRIHHIEFKYNLLFFEVDTTVGPRTFQMRWSVDRAHDYGEHSKVLLDVFDNRYMIPDLRDLLRADRELVNRFIYW